jgi:hypothetical protein
MEGSRVAVGAGIAGTVGLVYDALADVPNIRLDGVVNIGAVVTNYPIAATIVGIFGLVALANKWLGF